MAIILDQGIENPVLIDKYLMGTELEIDAICDGEDILIPGIMEQDVYKRQLSHTLLLQLPMTLML